MYVYVYVYVYVCVYVYVYVYVCVWLYMCIYVCFCMCICMYVCMYIYVYVYVCMQGWIQPAYFGGGTAFFCGVFAAFLRRFAPILCRFTLFSRVYRCFETNVDTLHCIKQHLSFFSVIQIKFILIYLISGIFYIKKMNFAPPPCHLYVCICMRVCACVY